MSKIAKKFINLRKFSQLSFILIRTFRLKLLKLFSTFLLKLLFENIIFKKIFDLRIKKNLQYFQVQRNFLQKNKILKNKIYLFLKTIVLIKIFKNNIIRYTKLNILFKK